jgi:hypothetical protein
MVVEQALELLLAGTGSGSGSHITFLVFEACSSPQAVPEAMAYNRLFRAYL